MNSFYAGEEPSTQRLLTAFEALLAVNAPDLRAALTAACQIVTDALAADKVDAFLLEPATNTLVAFGTSPTPLGLKQHAIGMHRLPIANGGREVGVYLTGAPYLTGRADEDPEQLRGVVDGLGVRSVAAEVFEVGGDRRGVLVACSARSDAFVEPDQQFLASAARWVGVLTHRIELVEQVAHEAHERGRQVAAQELIAILAHDLGNYLTPLKARIGVLQRRARRTDRADDLRDIQALDQSLDRMQRLIRDLLDASRLDEGVFSLNVDSVDLGALARETCNALATERTPIALDVDDGVVVRADAGRVRQVLENLLTNAAKHSPPGSPIEVKVGLDRSEAPQSAVIAVADHGPGVPADLRGRLFERFARGPNSNGLGLGLYLAKRISHAHGGLLMNDETVMTGARFLMELPLTGPGVQAPGP